MTQIQPSPLLIAISPNTMTPDALAKTYLATDRRYSRLMSEGEAKALAEANPIDDVNCDQVFAMRRARLLLACFPAGKPQDPEVYAMAVAAILADYPEVIVTAVTDPRSGVPRTLKFLPSVSEIAEACDRAMSDRKTLHNLAKQHLRIHHDPGYRDRLEAAIGYPVGRADYPGNATMAQRLDALAKKAVGK